MKKILIGLLTFVSVQSFTAEAPVGKDNLDNLDCERCAYCYSPLENGFRSHPEPVGQFCTSGVTVMGTKEDVRKYSEKYLLGLKAGKDRMKHQFNKR